MMAVTKKLLTGALFALAMALVFAGCAKGRSSNTNSHSKAPNSSASKSSKNVAAYSPQTRTIAMFAVPAWIGEMADIPAYKEFAPKDFKKGGLNDGNEVFAWQPQQIDACAGDTIKLAIGNPGPDDHTFTMPDFSVNTPVPTGKVTNVSFKAAKPGIYEYYCTVAEHTKYMHGTLLVFDDSDPICGA
jgi:plastocyanin